MKKIKIGPEKEWTPEEIRELLITNDKAVIKALITIYKKQSIEEQKYMVSTVENGVGFNRIDAPYLTFMATKAKINGGLKTGDVKVIRPIIMKYSRQLSKIANEKINVQMEWKI